MTSKHVVIVLAVWLSIPIAPAGASGADLRERRVTATAEVLAGIHPTPGDPDIDRLTTLEAFTEHEQWMTRQWAEVRSRLAAMQTWSAEEIRIPDAPGHTLLYPFSGPDFLNAYALFPHHSQYVFFSLEKPGELPDLASMPPAQFGKLLQDVRVAFRDIFERNYFITSYMTRQLTGPWLHGTVPVMATMMALMQLNIVHIEPVDLFPELARSHTAAHAGQPRRIMRGVRIDFTGVAGGTPQQLYYFAVDVTDRQLQFYPGFLDWVAGHRPATAMLKSASYLLCDRQFEKTRTMIMATADVIVQDDTGIPYRLLAEPGWHVRLYGHYERPTVKRLKYGYQADLESAYKARGDVPDLPFPFGYHWKGQASGLLIANR